MALSMALIGMSCPCLIKTYDLLELVAYPFNISPSTNV